LERLLCRFFEVCVPLGVDIPMISTPSESDESERPTDKILKKKFISYILDA
jgi:hypothetical protein